ncbi:MAG: hypothetical protein H7Z72_15505 [Bacteroidetes bacterium]|nr:hypothetical protein [Fibrella sp.]
MKKLIIFFLTGLMALSCSDHDPAPDTCKLSTSPTVKKLTYDGNSRVATMITEVFNSMTMQPADVLSTFSYDAAGKLTKTAYTGNGIPISEETYTYTDGSVSQVNFSGPQSPTGLNNLSYDAAGRLSRYTVEVGGKLQFAQTYAYNADGVLTERAVVDGQGNTVFKAVTKPVGSVKSPEQLLVSRGLPYLVATGDPFVSAEGGIGTVRDYFSTDNTGKLVPVGSEKITALKTNAKGYITELTVADSDGKNPSTSTYTLLDCN